ncbi:PLP-dependent aminotransferase family protein [Phreatobacter stygius]|uniref:PLP-dependent aminotransferase family protein n=2 Tax=Phreatobacter stygius TaxID=1940610 RepID=A0A4D7B8F7_9HYPH|nr:PLP-dependent aminotransferase family protein [Phreatobacter stygius]
MRTIAKRIASRTLEAGAKLPSIRVSAEALGVSKSTVVDAYDRLAAEGLIEPRRGSGFYVTGPTAPFSLADAGPRLDRAIDPLWVSRQALEAGDGVLMPGCGWLPASWMPEAGLRRAMRALSRRDPVNLTDYGPPLGLAPLRQLLARRMAEHGIEAHPSQIMLTDSGSQAIDLVCRLLIEPGDVVLVDDPGYFNFHAMLRAHRAKVVGVPYTPTGPDIGLFEQALKTHRPRLYITNSGPHNPTGASLSAVTAHRLLKLAEAHDLTIVEDDIFADFEHEPAPRLAAFDGFERVVHIGSFSKTLSAAVRCGFVAARPDWIEGLVDLKVATAFSSSPVTAELVLALLTDGSYRKHVEALRDKLARARGQVAARLRDFGLTPWVEPRAGMLLWMSLAPGIDAADIARRALAEKLVLAPGNAFSPSQSASGYLRFNVAQCLEPAVFTVLAGIFDS